MGDGELLVGLLVGLVVQYLLIYMAVLNAIKASREPEEIKGAKPHRPWHDR